MSTFARFDGKSYKLPDALILGRGEPFDISDRTLARAHARLVYSKGKWKIKDLGSDCGIMINGQKIQSGKFHSIVPGDKVSLGNVPLEVFDSLPKNEYIEVKNFTAHDINDYAPLIYGVLFVLAVIIAVSESTGNYTSDLIFLAVVAGFLKIASVVTRALRTVYFPVSVVLETNLTYDGATFHLTDDKNFSLKFQDVASWYIIGKCFFITAHEKDLILLLNEGHEELSHLLKEKCDKKRTPGEPLLEKLALAPLLFVFISWVSLTLSDARFFHFVGHGLGALGLVGLLGMFFSEHLRELLPIPRTISSRVQAFGLAFIIAVTMVMQFSQLQTHYRVTKLKKQLSSCFHEKDCRDINFSLLTFKKLPDEEFRLLRKICTDGNSSACEIPQKRMPASNR